MTSMLLRASSDYNSFMTVTAAKPLVGWNGNDGKLETEDQTSMSLLVASIIMRLHIQY